VIAGAQSLTIADYLRLHPRLMVGASVHGMEEARRACDEGAAFLLAGPVWPTPEKQGILEPLGPGELSEIAALGLPVIAIGGILAAEQVRAALGAGAQACAVLRATAQPEVLADLCRAAQAAAQG
jgi:thiamine monophosphate synthase